VVNRIRLTTGDENVVGDFSEWTSIEYRSLLKQLEDHQTRIVSSSDEIQAGVRRNAPEAVCFARVGEGWITAPPEEDTQRAVITD
jgi:hypothetical protein